MNIDNSNVEINLGADDEILKKIAELDDKIDEVNDAVDRLTILFEQFYDEFSDAIDAEYADEEEEIDVEIEEENEQLETASVVTSEE